MAKLSGLKFILKIFVVIFYLNFSILVQVVNSQYEPRSWHELGLNDVDEPKCDPMKWEKYEKPYQEKIIDIYKTKKYNAEELEIKVLEIQKEYERNRNEHNESLNTVQHRCVVHDGSRNEFLQFMTCDSKTRECVCIDGSPPRNFKTSRNATDKTDTDYKSKVCVGQPGAMCLKDLVHCVEGYTCEKGFCGGIMAYEMALNHGSILRLTQYALLLFSLCPAVLKFL